MLLKKIFLIQLYAKTTCHSGDKSNEKTGKVEGILLQKNKINQKKIVITYHLLKTMIKM